MLQHDSKCYKYNRFHGKSLIKNEDIRLIQSICLPSDRALAGKTFNCPENCLDNVNLAIPTWHFSHYNALDRLPVLRTTSKPIQK